MPHSMVQWWQTRTVHFADRAGEIAIPNNRRRIYSNQQRLTARRWQVLGFSDVLTVKARAITILTENLGFKPRPRRATLC